MSANAQQDLQRRSLAAVWHPCTQMARAAVAPPLPIARGEGAWLFDMEGRRYFDANSSWWVNLFGHADAGINNAIKRQLDILPHVMLAGCTHAPAVELAEKLSRLTGGTLGHTFFASDGASAVEIALKMSFHSWRNLGLTNKREFVCLKHGYHGETIGALAVTDVAVFRDAYDPLLMRAHVVESPDSRLGPEQEARAVADLRRALTERRGHVAALIIEPLVQCAAGMAMHEPSYLRAVRQLCDEFDVHLIADEIAVGCGRSGTFFAFEQGECGWPDFITLSKGISGGTLPLSLVLTTEAVYQSFWSDDVALGFLHSHSYTGNALACAAANAVLDRFAHDQVLEQNIEQARLLAQAFAPLARDARVEHLRQRGMMLAFDVKLPGDRFAERFHLAARERELLIRPIGRTVYLMPPYLVDAATAHFLFDAVAATLNEVLSDAS
ncbi:adenosylmethionine--8-amino-7-oxononanoate transaminase [Roseateles toxinivorans]|uniref:Adenosylmethionine-8-amino-7-oxononanoate aminotransferase n=1 Tax=Roseateles toxinivorans TaxID=270368 RepID=A0A4R6QAW1_9BURK|nr:adenosylmethionine--8-amino-7-oxononanoate transaminase [Roseateles toxinivorans]TDP58913.1 adenosylmethionine-8-amino-7-oxononanoate aminotransferase [Roseateles toxinivorans]